MSRMITAPLRYTDDVLQLMARDEELVPAAAIAPIIKMKPARMIEYVRSGQWPREICNYIVSGNRVKFYRIDFLRKGGWIHEPVQGIKDHDGQEVQNANV